jgi:nitric oxide reductase activation protein
VLDPRYQFKWTEDPAVKANSTALIIQHMDQQNSQLRSIAVETATASSTEDNSQDGSDGDDLLSFMNKREPNEDKSPSSELEQYLNDHSTNGPLLFWKENENKYPRLYTLHLYHHCVPATSAAVERTFSAAGYIASARRNRLTDSMLENMLVGKCNRDLLA